MLNIVYSIPVKIYEIGSDPGVDRVLNEGNPFISMADIVSASLYIDSSKVIIEVEISGEPPSPDYIVELSNGESSWDVTVTVYLSDDRGDRVTLTVQAGTSVYKYDGKVAIASASVEGYGIENYDGDAVYEVSGNIFRITSTFSDITFAPPNEDYQRFDVGIDTYIFSGQDTGGAQDAAKTLKALLTNEGNAVPGEEVGGESPSDGGEESPSRETVPITSDQENPFNLFPYILGAIVVIGLLIFAYFKFLKRPSI